MAAQPTPQEALETEVQPHEPQGYAGGPEMTLMEHLKELRNRVFISSIAVVIGIVVCFFFWEAILGWLQAPVRQHDPDFRLASFSPTDRLVVLFKIAMYGGILLASPVLVYQFLAFVVPGLTPRERRLILPAMLGVAVFMLMGMSFAYWVILPVSLEFLLNFGSSEIENVIGLRQYIDFATRVIFFVGLAFELPMVIALLAKLGMVNWRQLLGFWRYAIVLVFVIGAVATPTPDPLTQALVAGPLFCLYFVGIVFAYFLGPTPPPKMPKPA
jgi:sec-independent protein translocase protein TatC